MNLEQINADIEKYLNEKQLKLFECKYYKTDTTLQILLDEKLDVDQIEAISNDISLILDKYENDFDENYILDVSTVGVEKPIRNEDELKQAIGSYIYCKTKDNEYTGVLLDYTDGIIHMECKDKTRSINVSVDYAKTKKVRYAVKF